jgi:hypothetical protein
MILVGIIHKVQHNMYIYICIIYSNIKKRVPCSRWVIPKILLPSVQDIFKPLLFLPWALKHMQIRARMVRWSNQLYSWWWPWDLTPGSMLHGHEPTPADKIHITGFWWFLDPQKIPKPEIEIFGQDMSRISFCWFYGCQKWTEAGTTIRQHLIHVLLVDAGTSTHPQNCWSQPKSSHLVTSNI